MNILIDGQTFHSPERHRGIGRYLINILKYLYSNFLNNTYYISITDKIDLWDVPEIICKNGVFINMNIDSDEDSNLQEIQYRQALEECILEKEVDIYWNPNPLMTNILFAGKINGCKNVATVHDVIPLIFPEDYLDSLPMDIFEDYMSRILKLSLFDFIYADSQITKNDLIKYTDISEDRIIVINAGIDNLFFDKVSEEDCNEIKLRYGLTENYIFTLGGPDFRKNNINLIEAFSILNKKYKKDIHLVIGSYYDISTVKEMKKHAERLGVADRVMFTGRIPEGDLKGIYSQANIFLFPSFYEGFGLPVLEAMAIGVPVAASNTSSIPEVLGNVGFYFNPYDVQDIAKK